MQYVRNTKMLLLKLFVCLIFIFFTVAENVVVKIPNGSLKGRLEYSLRKNVTFYAFQQIPFAKPPIGKLRFQEPQPADPWNGTLDATTLEQKVCVQFANWGNYSGQTEDCLYLNVYTPKYPSTKNNLPVIFFIYGGGYNSGFAGFNQNGPHYLMETEVVVVTITYRLGPFGFLTTGDDVLPGNNGLKDQNLALQWVKKNIRYFGGDPKKVTIMGSSAGGASVTYHLMSKKSKGLFRAAISHSGSFLCPWSYRRDAKSFAYKLVANIDHTINSTSSPQKLLEILRNATLDKIINAANIVSSSLGESELIQGYLWAPVIEPHYRNAFITEPMYSALEGGRLARVPLLIGITSEEAISVTASPYFLEYSLKNYDANVSTLVNKNMNVKDSGTLQNIGTRIRNIYTNGLFQNSLGDAVRYFSDMCFTRSVIRHAHMQSIFSSVYFYQFSYDGELGGTRFEVEGTEKVAHAVEENYVWCYGNSSYLEKYPAQDVLTSERFRLLLTNFAKYLNPTPQKSEVLQNIKWPKAKNYDFKYIDINANLTIQTDPKNATYPKWVQLYDDEAYRPFITY